jgi:hypothetical protein
MANLTITAGSVIRGTNSTPRRGTAGATIAAGDVLYFDPSVQKLKLADSNGGAAGDHIRKFRGIATNGASDGQDVNYVAADDDLTIGGTLVPGVPYFMSSTPGKLCELADLSAGATVTFIGIAKTTTKLRVAPSAGGEVPTP